MCIAIRFNRFEFSDQEIQASELPVSGDEVRVYFAKKDPLLPIHYRGNNRLVSWGNKLNNKVPRSGYCKLESLESGKWQWFNPEPVTILASVGLTNGVWFQIRQGIKGVLIKDNQGVYHVYILMTPSTHYFKIMTGADRMPVLINQIL